MGNKVLTISLVLLALLLGYKLVETRVENTNLQARTQVLAAVQDTLHHYEDKYGRVVAEKRVIAADLSTIRAEYGALSESQRRLLQEIDDLPRKQHKAVVSATQVQQTATIHLVDSVLVPGQAHLAWKRQSDTLNYDIRVQDSVLTIHNLQIANRLTLATYRDNKKALHVRVTNSNPMFRTSDVDQVVLEKPKKESKLVKILVFVGGVIAGSLLSH